MRLRLLVINWGLAVLTLALLVSGDVLNCQTVSVKAPWSSPILVDASEAPPKWADNICVEIPEKFDPNAVPTLSTARMRVILGAQSGGSWEVWIAKCVALKELEIDGGDASVDLARILHILLSLELDSLVLRRCNVLESAVKTDPSIRPLESVVLLNNTYGGSALAAILRLCNPLHLEIGSAYGLPKESQIHDVTVFQGLSRVQRLSLRHTDPVLKHSVALLTGLKSLTSLSVETSDFVLPSTFADALKRLARLEYLSLNCVNKDVLGAMKECRSLSALRITCGHSTPIKDVAAAIESVPNLKEVELIGCRFDNKLVEAIGRCEQLTKVRLQGSFGEDSLKGLASWKCFSTLVALSLYGLPANIAALGSFVSKCERLEAMKLVFFDRPEPADVAECLKGCRHIHDLSIQRVTITQPVMDVLGSLAIRSLALGLLDNSFAGVDWPLMADCEVMSIALSDSRLGNKVNWRTVLEQLPAVRHVEVVGWDFKDIVGLLRIERLASLRILSCASLTADSDWGEAARTAPLLLQILDNDLKLDAAFSRRLRSLNMWIELPRESKQ